MEQKINIIMRTIRKEYCKEFARYYNKDNNCRECKIKDYCQLGYLGRLNIVEIFAAYDILGYDLRAFTDKNVVVKKPENVKVDNVNHPVHYQGKHECIDEMIELFGIEMVKGFCMCNVYKYRYRATRKNGEEDIKKAEWYMDKLIELNNVK